MLIFAQGGWTRLGRLRIEIMEKLVAEGRVLDYTFSLSVTLIGVFTLPSEPHFLWITQFPLFTRADDDKTFLSKGRWASSHHPFTAPMWEDLELLKQGKVDAVSIPT